MKICRKNIFKRYKWLNEKKRFFIISSDYDGAICASYLKHQLNWTLSGYYDYNSIWLSNDALKNKHELIWVDLNILPISGKSVGGQIISLGEKTPYGFKTSCNANILAGINENNFKNKFPFSTLLFLMWLHQTTYTKNGIGKLLLLQSDDTWIKIQKYSQNAQIWGNYLTDYNWGNLLSEVDTIQYETKIDQSLYPQLIYSGVVSGYSNLVSKHLKIKSRKCKFNPDWDEDVLLKLFDLFAQYLNWGPPILPKIIKRIEGNRYKSSLNNVKKVGLDIFLKKNNIFSYAITNPKMFNYTVFPKISS